MRSLAPLLLLHRCSAGFERACNESLTPKGAHKHNATPPVGFVVLKQGNSGSSWFSSMIARLDKTYFLDEAFTNSGAHAAPASDADLRRYLARALAEPTGYYGKGEGCPRWAACSPGALACFVDRKCRLRAVGFSYNPLPSDGGALAPLGRVVPAWLLANVPAARLVVWVRTNVVKMALATHGDKAAARDYAATGPSDPAKRLAKWRASVPNSTAGLGGPDRNSELSSSVKSESIRLIFGRIDCARRVLEARPKSLRRNGRIRSH